MENKGSYVIKELACFHLIYVTTTCIIRPHFGYRLSHNLTETKSTVQNIIVQSITFRGSNVVCFFCCSFLTLREVVSVQIKTYSDSLV